MILSSSAQIYTGVSIDTCSTLGICAERNAVFNMITNGESIIQKVIAIMPDGRTEEEADSVPKVGGIVMRECDIVNTCW